MRGMNLDQDILHIGEETLLPDVAHMMILILTINVAHLCSFQITKRPNVFGNYEKIDE